MIQAEIRKLVQYGLITGLVPEEDKRYTTNRLLELFELDELEDMDEATAAAVEAVTEEDLEDILNCMMDYAVEQGIMKEDGIVYRDLFDTKIMSILLPRPSEIIRTFRELYKESPEKATDYYYKLSCDTDYIRRYRIKKDMKWLAPTQYGDLDITTIPDKPVARAKVGTNLVPQAKYADMLKFISLEAQKGNKIYFVAPKIEGDLEGEVMSVTDLYNELSVKKR